MRLAIVTFFGALLLLTACTGDSSKPEDGVTYAATDSTGFALVAGSSASIMFDDGHVTLNTGCNTASGKAAWSGNVLKPADVAITEMGCEDELMTQEQRFMDLLTSGPQVTRAGDTLTLSGTLADGSKAAVTFTERLNTALENTSWNLEGLGTNDGQTFTAIPEGVRSTLAFTDTEVMIEYGCNGGGGQVNIGADTLTFGNLVMTLMACENEAMKVENHVAQVLQGEVEYSVNGPTLTITNGALSLQYTPAA